MHLVGGTAKGISWQHDTNSKVNRVKDACQHAHVGLRTADDECVAPALVQLPSEIRAVKGRIDALINKTRRRNETAQGLYKIEQVGIDLTYRHLPPSFEVTPPSPLYFLRPPRRNEAREDSRIGMCLDKFYDDGEDPLHPRGVPRRPFGKHVLHVDAQMDGPWPKRTPFETNGTHRLQTFSASRLIQLLHILF